MWKVDYAKVYVMIDWRLPWVSMLKQGFPREWVIWVKCSITSHTFLVLVESRPEGG